MIEQERVAVKEVCVGTSQLQGKLCTDQLPSAIVTKTPTGSYR